MTASFKDLLRDNQSSADALLSVSCQDALSAKIIEMAGIKCAGLGGSTVSQAILGLPDAGYVTLADMEYILGKISLVTSIPIFVDLDVGYGNAQNVDYAVRSLERLGAAAIMLEDQTFPSRTPSFGKIGIVSSAEMVGKVKAALDARENSDFFVIARTDARLVEGLDGAIDRANLYAQAGADCVFISGYRDRESLERIGAEVEAPYQFAVAAGLGQADDLSLSDFREMGFDIVMWVGDGLYRACCAAMLRTTSAIREGGLVAGVNYLSTLTEGLEEQMWALTGWDSLNAFEAQYITK